MCSTKPGQQKFEIGIGEALPASISAIAYFFRPNTAISTPPTTPRLGMGTP
jgi:hypothetical protein